MVPTITQTKWSELRQRLGLQVSTRIGHRFALQENETLIELREKVRGEQEEQYQVLVTAPPNKQFRVYVNRPGRKGVMMGQQLVRRNAFPELLFIDN